jgi:hypothetical protein
MGIEMTSSFNSQLINALQFIPPFNKCCPTTPRCLLVKLAFTDFGNGYIDLLIKSTAVAPPLLRITNASYSLGVICVVPFAPAF